MRLSRIIAPVFLLLASILPCIAQDIGSFATLTGAGVNPATDKILIWDASATSPKTRGMTIAELVNVFSFTNGNFLAANSVEVPQVNGLQAALDAKAAQTALDAKAPVATPSTSKQTYLIHENFRGIGLNDPVTTAAGGVILLAKDRICNPGPGKITFTYGSFTGSRVLDGLQYVVRTSAAGQTVRSNTKHTIVPGLALITKFTASSYCRDNLSIGWGNSETTCDSAGVGISSANLDGTRNYLAATTLHDWTNGSYNISQTLSRQGLEDGVPYGAAVEWVSTTKIRIWIQGGEWERLYDAKLGTDRWFPLIEHKVTTTNSSLYAIVSNATVYGNSVLKMQEFSVVQNFSPSPDLKIVGYNETGGAAHIPAILLMPDGSEIVTWNSGTTDPDPDQVLYGAVRTAAGVWTAPQLLIPAAGSGTIQNNGSMAIINGQIWWIYMRSNVGVTAYPHYYRILTYDSAGTITMGAETAIPNLASGYLCYGPPVQTPTGRIIIPAETYNVPRTFTAATTDICTAAAHGYSTGYMLRLSTSGALPGGLSAGTDYFAIRLTADTFKLASTYANAVAGTAVDVTSTGSGTHTLTGDLVQPGIIYSDDSGATWTTLFYGSSSLPAHSPEYTGYNAEMTIAIEPGGTLRAITRTSARGTATNPPNPDGVSLTATSANNGTSWSTFEPYHIPQTLGGPDGDLGQRIVARKMPDGRIIAFGSDDQLQRRRLTAWIIGNNGRIDDQMLFANTPQKSAYDGIGAAGGMQYPDGFYKDGYLTTVWGDKTFGAASPNNKSKIVYVKQRWRSGSPRDTLTPVMVPYSQHRARADVDRTVALVDAATIALNADEGNVFSVLMTSGVGSTRVLGNPINPTDGQIIRIRIRQASDTGSRAITLGGDWRNSLTLTVSASANANNYLSAIYDGKDGKWDVFAWN